MTSLFVRDRRRNVTPRLSRSSTHLGSRRRSRQLRYWAAERAAATKSPATHVERRIRMLHPRHDDPRPRSRKPRPCHQVHQIRVCEVRVRLSALHERWLGLVRSSSQFHPVIADSAGLLGLVDAIRQPGLVAFATSNSLQVVEVDLFADGDGEVAPVRILDITRGYPSWACCANPRYG